MKSLLVSSFRRGAFAAVLSGALLFVPAPVFAWNSVKVQVGPDGRLSHPADAAGNRIPDFSHAGYKGGGVPLPEVPVRVTISPIPGDNTAHIQAAVDAVAAMPVQADGYRGAVLLSAGVYEVVGTIRLNQSGVVLSGVGDGDDPAANTILRRTGTSQADVITAGGGADDQFRSEVAGTRRQITAQRVSVGSRNFTVDDASPFAVGDNVIVLHPSTPAWIAAMDNGGVTDTNVWQPGQLDIRYHRYITAISGNTITIDAPVFNHLDRALSQSYLFKYDRSGVLTHLGVEDLQIDIVTAGPTAETHAKSALRFLEAEDSWVRDCTMKHFWYAGVEFAGSTRCTAENVRALEPHSVVTGGRRYNFTTTHAQLILFRDCYASYARHGFVANGTSTCTGNVVLNGTLANNITFSEGHRRWSTGLLFDGIATESRSGGDVMGFYNRGNYGTGHGWAAGHSVLWRCDAAGGKVLVQQPPTAQNYAIGCFGNVTGSGPFAGPVGYIEGANTAGLEPQSLYLAQLADRQNNAAPIDLTPPTAPTLSSTGAIGSTVGLAWTVAADNVGVVGYEVFRDGVFAGFSTGTSFTVTGLGGDTAYTFTVHAKDEAGNGTASNAVTVTTPPGAPVAQPIAFEAENLAYQAVNGSYAISFEDSPSGGAYASPNITDPADPLYPVRRRFVTFGGDGSPPPPGSEYIEFVLPDVPAGVYNLRLRYKSHPNNRATLSLSVDGAVVGTPLNQLATATFPTRDFGVVRFAERGGHVVRLSIVDKTNSATNTLWNLTADVITLVPDTTAPVIAPLADQTIEATGPEGATATFATTATDNADGSVPVIFTPESGSVFPLGTTLVVGTAEDASGNIAATSFHVNVADTTRPVLSLPADIVAEATSPAGAAVTFAASAVDLVGGEVGVGLTPASGATFPLGTTVVVAEAVDEFENVATGTFTVTVRDTTAPVIEQLTASPDTLTPPNQRMVPVTLTAVVHDLADPAPVTRIVSVTANQPTDGNAPGNTPSDWRITGNLTLELRAEHAGSAGDRIYTITVESLDASGNASTRTVAIVVPHDDEP